MFYYLKYLKFYGLCMIKMHTVVQTSDIQRYKR
jgi:hypothetical protein